MILYFIRDHNNIFVISFCNIKNIDIMEWRKEKWKWYELNEINIMCQRPILPETV